MSGFLRPPQRPEAVRERDAAMARAGRVRGVAIAGSAVLSAGFAGLVAATAPGSASAGTHAHATAGHTHAAAAVTSSRGAGVPEPALPPLEGPGALGLQGPAQDPGSDVPQTSSDGSAPAPSDQAPAASQPPADSSPPATQSAPAPAPAPAPSAAPAGGVVSGGS